MEKVKLYVISLELGFNHLRYLMDKVSDEQKEIAENYAHENDQIRSLLSSYLKNLLSKDKLNKNAHGKPYFDKGPFFNISHSGQYVVMAVSNKEIGVDIEENNNRDTSMLLRIFNRAEAKMVKEHSDFFYLWCAKESLIKCMGSSINNIRDVPSLPLNGLKTYKGKDYQCQAFIYDKHIVSITRETNEEFTVDIEKIEKLS